MKGANATLTTLSPKLVLTAFGTKDVLTPDLLCPTLCSVVIVVSSLLPTRLTCLFVSLTCPDHVSFQLFHTVPKFKSNTPAEARFVSVSKVPGIAICISGCLSVSNHSSISGSNVIVPIKSITLNGCKFTVLLAKGCS